MRIKNLAVLLLLLGICLALPFFSGRAAVELADGYYLIHPGWTVDAIDPGERFETNPNQSGEYMLNTALSVGDSIKVVRVAGNAIVQWFPEGTGNEHHVTENTPHGNVRIYFWPGSSDPYHMFEVLARYPITVETGIEGGSISASHTDAPRNETVTLTCTGTDEGYELVRYIVTAGGGLIDVSNSGTFLMPESAVTVSAEFKKIDYAIDVVPMVVNGKQIGTAATDPSGTAHLNDTVTLSNIPEAGYAFGSYTVTKASGGTVDVVDGRFTMPADDVTVTASFSGITYGISTSFDSAMGTVTAPASAATGDTVSFTVAAEEGFLPDGIPAVKMGGTDIRVTSAGNGQYIFEMPAGAVTISAAFMQQLSDGYYLIGTVASLSDGGWTINDINKNSALFMDNPACTAGPEYVLTGIVLTAGDAFKIVYVEGNVIRAWYPSGSDNTNYVVDDAHSGERIIYFRPAGRTDDYWSYIDPPTWDYFYVAPRNEELTDANYYLIGPDWAATDIDPEELFFANPGVSDGSEFILLTYREQGNEIKVARVDLDHAITAWYPDGFYNQHYVTGEEAGDEVIYFRPAGNSGWGTDYYFYIAPPRYITVESPMNGTLTVSAGSDRYLRASRVYTDPGSDYRRNFTFAGARLTVTAEPDTGWEPDAVTVENDADPEDLIEVSDGSFIMPSDKHVRVKASFKQSEYTASITTEGSGDASLSRESGLHYGDTVTVTVEPAAGSRLKGIMAFKGTEPVEVTAAAGEEGKYTFTMPAGDVDVRVVFEPVVYTVTVGTDGNGSAKAEPATGTMGTSVLLSSEPYDGYAFREWQVLAGGVTIDNDSFRIGTADVRIMAHFSRVATPTPEPTAEPTATPTAAATATATATATAVVTATASTVPTPTETATATSPVVPTVTPAPTASATVTATVTPAVTPTPTAVPTVTPTATAETYTIRYDPNGGLINGSGRIVSSTHLRGEVITIREAPVRDGWIFMYWEGSEHHPGDRYTVTGDHTFTAQWRREDPYRYLFTFDKKWQGGREDEISWTLYRADGSVARRHFNKTVVSETEWHYEAWFPTDEDYYIIEDAPKGYFVRYENVGVHADETDRCYNGGTILNYAVPKTGDDAAPGMWGACVLAGLIGLAAACLLYRRRKRS